MIPQLIIICIVLVGIGVDIAKHGKREVKETDAWTSLIASAITFGILYWGGFFDVFLK